MRHAPHPTRSVLVLVAAVVLAAAMTACSTQASTRTDAAADPTAAAAPQVTLSKAIPAGTTLRVGDQLDYLKTLLSLAGQDQNFPYNVEYSSFVGGPPMLQAFQANAIDAGFIGSTPLIFVQAGNQPIVAIAGWATEHSSYGLVTAPGVTDINGWQDLKGKKVAYQEGTALEAALLEQLDKVGLKLSDITPVKLPLSQVTTALQGGAADAGVPVEPLTSVYLTANPTAKKIPSSDELTDRSSFMITTQSALADAGKEAALGDYLSRVVKAITYLQSHPDQLVQGFYVKQYKVTPEQGSQLVAQAGKTTFFSLPGDIVPPQQHLADLFQANGEIPGHVDVSQEFDGRFNSIVQQEQGS